MKTTIKKVDLAESVKNELAKTKSEGMAERRKGVSLWLFG